MILIYQSDQIDMVSSSWIGKLNVRFAYKMSYTQMASETRKTHLVNSFPPMTAQNMETTSERNWWQKRRQRRCRRASERTEAHISRRRETRRTACHCGSRARQTRDEAHPPSPRGFAEFSSNKTHPLENSSNNLSNENWSNVNWSIGKLVQQAKQFSQ